MPIVSGAYVNPGWVDDQAPAINATELNAMSDTIAGNQAALPHLYQAGTIVPSTVISKADYDALEQSGQVDPNVLYLVYEGAGPS